MTDRAMTYKCEKKMAGHEVLSIRVGDDEVIEPDSESMIARCGCVVY